MPELFGFLIYFSLLIIAMSVHEFFHGWVAYKLGDNTARLSGRLTLNPMAHIDPIGTVILPLILFISTKGQFVFGAAKPVPINYWALKNPRRDMALIGISGPAANFVFAFLLSLIFRILPVDSVFNFAIKVLVEVNVILGFFNLIPIPPLDGSRILAGILPPQISEQYARIEPYGFFIIIILSWMGLLSFIWPLMQFITFRLLGSSYF